MAHYWITHYRLEFSNYSYRWYLGDELATDGLSVTVMNLVYYLEKCSWLHFNILEEVYKYIISGILLWVFNRTFMVLEYFIAFSKKQTSLLASIRSQRIPHSCSVFAVPILYLPPLLFSRRSLWDKERVTCNVFCSSGRRCSVLYYPPSMMNAHGLNQKLHHCIHHCLVKQR